MQKRGGTVGKDRHNSDTYLEAIHVLQSEMGSVIAARMADYLGVSRPTVTQMLKRLSREGLVQVQSDHAISLTAAGDERARATIRRHRIIERWLTDVLGLDWGSAHIEASRLEQAVSPLIESRLEEVLGHPATCPHGNVIPGNGQVAEAVALATIAAPQEVEVVRIFEQAEEDADLLRYLESHGFVPSGRVTVLPTDLYDDAMTVSVRGQDVRLAMHVAERIMVRQVSSQPAV